MCSYSVHRAYVCGLTINQTLKDDLDGKRKERKTRFLSRHAGWYQHVGMESGTAKRYDFVGEVPLHFKVVEPSQMLW